jgi:hypothetical protein
MNAGFILIQPPFVQLNSPYPSIYYLRSFLKSRGCEVIVRDHSIALFEKIFCKQGLQKIFTDIKSGDCFVTPQLKYRRIIETFLCEEERWLSMIDKITAFLRGADKEFSHLIALSNGVLPSGPSYDACLAEIYRQKGEAGADDAPLLASKLLSDIAGLVNVVDSNFSLVRYVPMAAAGINDFSYAENALNSYIINTFYRPFLKSECDEFAGFLTAPVSFLGLTIPFPGCLTGALVCAESVKACFGNRIKTIAGGGYINTELRFLEEERFFSYFDYVSFDRSYGSLDAIIDRETGRSGAIHLYKTMYLHDNAIIRDERIACDNLIENIPPVASYIEGIKTDNEAVMSIFPDYSGVDFNRYICPVDDQNPMHRLWSEGVWLKAYAAYGCYWQKCTFCDVTLDYIRCFKKLDSKKLFNHLLEQSKNNPSQPRSGVHLVDEACPHESLLELALLNRRAGLPLVFWGNIRFDKAFTPDMAAILAAGGVIGVSAGIEIAGDRGLDTAGKGVKMQDIVSVCAAFKEAGILVHAYLMYGYWDQSDDEIINSTEVIRQFFEAGLLDSAFWHQFILTVHSRVYNEWQNGRHSGLQPVIPLSGKKKFAFNDISFKGAGRFNRYSQPLDILLDAWMKGNTSMPVHKAFNFEVREAAVEPQLIETLLDHYARSRDKNRACTPVRQKIKSSRVMFIPANVIIREKRSAVHAKNVKRGTPSVEKKEARLVWRWRYEDCVLKSKPGNSAKWACEIRQLLIKAAEGMDAESFYHRLESVAGNETETVWKYVRKHGLCLINTKTCSHYNEKKDTAEK